MPLTCSSSVIQYEDFEFIDCGTISISYNKRGLANISFTVVTTKSTLFNDYTNMTFGGVTFNGWITDLQISTIPGTLVYLFRISYVAFGC